MATKSPADKADPPKRDRSTASAKGKALKPASQTPVKVPPSKELRPTAGTSSQEEETPAQKAKREKLVQEILNEVKTPTRRRRKSVIAAPSKELIDTAATQATLRKATAVVDDIDVDAILSVDNAVAT